MESLEALKSKVAGVSSQGQQDVLKLIERQAETLTRLKEIYRPGAQGVRIRCHGRYHLGEVLHTGKDLFIIDFEGDPARAASERRIKRAPAYDLASMIFSFHSAALSSVGRRIESGVVAPEKWSELEQWGEAWAGWAAVAFLKGYLASDQREVLKISTKDLDLLLNCHLIDRSAKELTEALRGSGSTAAIPMGVWTNTLGHWSEPED